MALERWVQQFPEKLNIGDTSLSVLREVLRLNPDIKAITITFCDDFTSSNDDQVNFAQQLVWLPARLAFEEETLQRISELNYDTNLSEGEVNKIMGVGSKVRLSSGETMHIPMMDFVSDPEQTGVKVIEDNEAVTVFSQTPGVILDSGNSFHFWGVNLLSDSEYKESMKNRLEMENKRCGLGKKPIYDKRYVEASLKRGFSVLRIFGYPFGTLKETEPEVVQIIK
jgi:hypothetical protein